MVNRNQRFAQVEHAENAGATLRRVAAYFAREKTMVLAMLAVVIFGTASGVYAPSLQSGAIDIIAGVRIGSLTGTVLRMLVAYLVYSGCQLLQGLLSARLSQRIVQRNKAGPAAAGPAPELVGYCSAKAPFFCSFIMRQMRSGSRGSSLM